MKRKLRVPVLMEGRNLTRVYGETVAVRRVSIKILGGEVLALVGKNGAGKSTLLRLLAGLEAPDRGQVHSQESDGAPNVAHVPQELEDFPELSVAENVMLYTGLPKTLGFVSWRKVHAQTREVLRELGLEDIEVMKEVAKLSVAQRRLIMVGRALQRRAPVVLFDEPSEGVSKSDRSRLFEIIQGLKERGAGIVYSSHRLKEVIRLADRIAIMRDGALVSIGPRQEFTHASVMQQISGVASVRNNTSGADINEGSIRRETRGNSAVLFNMAQQRGLSSVSIRRSEILGIVGLVGSGRSHFVESLVMHYRALKGTGAAMLIPEDRLDGIFRDLVVRENISLTALHHCRRWRRVPLVQVRRERGLAGNWIRALNIKSRGVEDRVTSLSGGNQQKVLLARALAARSELVVLDEPTKGLDVSAKAELFEIMQRLVRDGIAVIVVDADLEELANVSDRFLILSGGTAIEELEAGQSEKDLLERCFALHDAGEVAHVE